MKGRKYQDNQTNGDKLYQQGELKRKMVNGMVGHVMYGTKSNWRTNYMNEPIGQCEMLLRYLMKGMKLKCWEMRTCMV